jgi:hypothetical protein
MAQWLQSLANRCPIPICRTLLNGRDGEAAMLHETLHGFPIQISKGPAPSDDELEPFSQLVRKSRYAIEMILGIKNDRVFEVGRWILCQVLAKARARVTWRRLTSRGSSRSLMTAYHASRMAWFWSKSQNDGLEVINRLKRRNATLEISTNFSI